MMKSNQAKAPEDGVDMISNLPDDILQLILSRFPTTEEVSRTSILSRRWRYLWTSVPSIDINYSRELKCPTESQAIKFEKFVDWALESKALNLDSFRLRSWNYYYATSTSTVTRWIYAAVSRNIKSLHLEFCSENEPYEAEDFVVPNCLATCDSLEELRFFLTKLRLILPKIIGFPGLRVLELNGVELSHDDDLGKDFFSSCPLLEELSLIGCVISELDGLCISCPKLKNLRIDNRTEGGKFEFEYPCAVLKIFCAHVVFFELGAGIAYKYFVESMSFVKKAVIHNPEYPEHIEDDTFRELLMGISNVESLSTTSDICSFIYEKGISLRPWS